MTLANPFDDLAGASGFPIHALGARGGCNCKLGPRELGLILKGMPSSVVPDVLVGLADRDDAAVVELQNGQVLAMSIDFQNPVVPDYRIAGAIAAANAMSDIYAMGLRPQFANAILSVSEGGNVVAEGREFMAGLHTATGAAGCFVIGGHTFLGLEPFCGLAVYGIGDRTRIKTKRGARPGDVLILTKPIGTGLLTAARGLGYPIGQEHIDLMLRLNVAGAWLGEDRHVHAMTDISGFGLLGHACEMAKASKATLEFTYADLPLLAGAFRYAMEGVSPTLAQQTLSAWQNSVEFPDIISDAQKAVLADPQTNGGLLLAVNAGSADALLQRLRSEGDREAKIVGRVGDLAADRTLVRIRGVGS